MPTCNGMDRGCTIPSRESEQTSLWSFSARTFDEPIKEVKQMMMETTEGQSSDPSVGATTDTLVAWHQINWRKAERNVRRLQTRIAQATQAGKWGKVKAFKGYQSEQLRERRVTSTERIMPTWPRVTLVTTSWNPTR